MLGSKASPCCCDDQPSTLTWFGKASSLSWKILVVILFVLKLHPGHCPGKLALGAFQVCDRKQVTRNFSEEKRNNDHVGCRNCPAEFGCPVIARCHRVASPGSWGTISHGVLLVAKQFLQHRLLACCAVHPPTSPTGNLLQLVLHWLSVTQ